MVKVMRLLDLSIDVAKDNLLGVTFFLKLLFFFRKLQIQVHIVANSFGT